MGDPGGRSTVSNTIKVSCEGIWEALRERYLKAPETTDCWLNITAEFENEWNFPNYLGSLDGKHICIECTKNSGSSYFNYESFHSMVLLVICDAKYCFILVDIGSYGRDNNVAVLSESTFGRLLESGPSSMSIPLPHGIYNFKLHSPHEIISTVCDFPCKIIEKCFQ